LSGSLQWFPGSEAWSVARGGRALAAALAALCLAACGPGTRTAQETLIAYTEAVQAEDLDTLFCMSAGVAEAVELGADEAERRANFDAWAREWYRAYLDGRDAGWVEIGEHGIVLVKLFALGRGTFYSLTGVRPLGSDAVEVETRLRFGYSGLDLSRLSPGTTFYLCGEPLGRVHPIVVRPYEEVSVKVLESVTVRWTLVRHPAFGGCAEGWAVAAVDPVTDSVDSETITWVF
jgi:hypothetical protein